jgi:predicted nucleotidyltransferase component of viral defense system
MTNPLEQALKSKLQQIAKDVQQDPLAIWQNLFLERFLVRLAHSPYQHHFVLKGGILLSKYVQLGRETQDLDFFAKNLKNEVNGLETIFRTIAQLDIGDGFEFKDVTIRPLSHPHMSYLGAHISMRAFFGKIRFKVTIDLGFGDQVKEIRQDLPLLRTSKGPLFEESISINCYPKEFIFAEKLETVIYRGGANSRMKDFHDLYTMITGQEQTYLQNFKDAIAAVFTHRQTPMNLPVQFSEADIQSLENYWAAYRKELNHTALKHPLPITLQELIETLNLWLCGNIL